MPYIYIYVSSPCHGGETREKAEKGQRQGSIDAGFERTFQMIYVYIICTCMNGMGEGRDRGRGRGMGMGSTHARSSFIC